MPEVDQRGRPYMKMPVDSWLVDETYIKVKKEGVCLDQVVDSHGNTLKFLLSATRDT